MSIFQGTQPVMIQTVCPTVFEMYEFIPYPNMVTSPLE